MRVQRNDISRCNACVNNAYPPIFQQQSMVSRRGDERIKRVRPRPVFRVGKNRIDFGSRGLERSHLSHLFIACPVSLSHVPSRNTTAESPVGTGLYLCPGY
jgi:hypothetical protein